MKPMITVITIASFITIACCLLSLKIISLNEQLITATIAVFGFIGVMWQLDESIKSNRLKALIYMFRDLSSYESRENRGFVELELEGKTWGDLKKDKTSSRVTSVWSSFDQIAYMVSKGYLPKKDVTDMWGHTIKWCHCASKDVLEQARDERAKKNEKSKWLKPEEAKEYMKYFYDLGRELTDC